MPQGQAAGRPWTKTASDCPNCRVVRLRTSADRVRQVLARKLDDVRIWNVARKGADITANYQAELQGQQPGLVANWHLDESSGLTAFDTSVNHDATLHGGAAGRSPMN
jgi:hypothetical protein